MELLYLGNKNEFIMSYFFFYMIAGNKFACEEPIFSHKNTARSRLSYHVA